MFLGGGVILENVNVNRLYAVRFDEYLDLPCCFLGGVVWREEHFFGAQNFCVREVNVRKLPFLSAWGSFLGVQITFWVREVSIEKLTLMGTTKIIFGMRKPNTTSKNSFWLLGDIPGDLQ